MRSSASNADRPAIDDFAGGLAEITTGRELLGRLRTLSQRQGTTLFVTLLAGLAALLVRYTGQDDLVIGTMTANRGREELARLIGFLVNTLPIRIDASGDPPFTELLGRVRAATIGAYAHQDLPFAKIVPDRADLCRTRHHAGAGRGRRLRADRADRRPKVGEIRPGLHRRVQGRRPVDRVLLQDGLVRRGKNGRAADAP